MSETPPAADTAGFALEVGLGETSVERDVERFVKSLGRSLSGTLTTARKNRLTERGSE